MARARDPKPDGLVASGATMPDPDTLHTLAQIAMTLAGLSGVVAVLRRGAGDEWSRVARARLFSLLYPAIGAAFFPFLPGLLEPLAGAQAGLRMAFSLLLLFTITGIATFYRIAPLGQYRSSVDRWVSISLTAVGGVFLLAQLAVIAGCLHRGAPSLYTASLLFLLLTATVNFGMMLLEQGDQ